MHALVNMFLCIYYMHVLVMIIIPLCIYSKTCVKRPLSKDQKLVLKTNYRLMQVKINAECSKHSAILSTLIKLPFVIKIFVLSIFE